MGGESTSTSGGKPHADGDNPAVSRVTKRLSRKKRYVHIYVIYIFVTLVAVIPYSIVAFNPDIAMRGYFTASKPAPAKPAHTRNIETERGLLKIPGEYIASYIIDKAKSSVAEATTVVEVESSLVAAKATDIASMVSDVASKASNAASKVHLPNIASKASEMVAEASAKVSSEVAKLMPTEIEMGSRSFCAERNETLNCKRDPSFADINEHLATVIFDASQWESLLKYASFANGSVASAIAIGFPLFALLLYTLQVFEPQLSSHWSFAWLSHANLQRWLTLVSFSVLCISVVISIVSLIVATYIWKAAKTLKTYYAVKGCPILVYDVIGVVAMILLPAILAGGHTYIKRAKRQSGETDRGSGRFNRVGSSSAGANFEEGKVAPEAAVGSPASDRAPQSSQGTEKQNVQPGGTVHKDAETIAGSERGGSASDSELGIGPNNNLVGGERASTEFSVGSELPPTLSTTFDWEKEMNDDGKKADGSSARVSTEKIEHWGKRIGL